MTRKASCDTLALKERLIENATKTNGFSNSSTQRTKDFFGRPLRLLNLTRRGGLGTRLQVISSICLVGLSFLPVHYCFISARWANSIPDGNAKRFHQHSYRVHCIKSIQSIFCYRTSLSAFGIHNPWLGHFSQSALARYNGKYFVLVIRAIASAVAGNRRYEEGTAEPILEY